MTLRLVLMLGGQNRPLLVLNGDIADVRETRVAKNSKGAHQVSVDFTVALTNSGQSDVNLVGIQYELIRGTRGFIRGRIPELCKAAGGQKINESIATSMKVSQPVSAQLEPGEVVPQWLAGCIAYSGSDGTVYHRSAVYDVRLDTMRLSADDIPYRPILKFTYQYGKAD